LLFLAVVTVMAASVVAPFYLVNWIGERVVAGLTICRKPAAGHRGNWGMMAGGIGRIGTSAGYQHKAFFAQGGSEPLVASISCCDHSRRTGADCGARQV
jgi:hypothetical protein